MFLFIISILLKIISIIIPLLISVAYFTIAERKLMGIIQRRKGPNVIGFIGLLQPLADGLKLFAKETILPSNSNLVVFLFAPALTFILSLIGWAVIPFSEEVVLADLNVGILYLFAVSSGSGYAAPGSAQCTPPGHPYYFNQLAAICRRWLRHCLSV